MNDLNSIEIPRYEHPDFVGTIQRKGGEAEVLAARKQHDLEHATALKATDTLTKIASERAKLEQKQSELAAKADAEMITVAEYNSSVKYLSRERRILELARLRFQALKADIAAREQYLHESCWGCFDEDPLGVGGPATIQKWYSVLAGTKAAVADFPNWEAGQVAKIQSLEATIAAFAKQHGINA